MRRVETQELNPEERHVTSTHNALVTVHDTDVEQTNDSTQNTKGTNNKQIIAYI